MTKSRYCWIKVISAIANKNPSVSEVYGLCSVKDNYFRTGSNFKAVARELHYH